MYEEQLTETRSKKTQEITELDGQLQTEYEARLRESLQELRDQYELQMKTNRDEIEAIYENKVTAAGAATRPTGREGRLAVVTGRKVPYSKL